MKKKTKRSHPKPFKGARVKELVLELDHIRKKLRTRGTPACKLSDKELKKIAARCAVVYDELHAMGTYYMRQLRKRKEGIGIWA